MEGRSEGKLEMVGTTPPLSFHVTASHIIHLGAVFASDCGPHFNVSSMMSGILFTVYPQHLGGCLADGEAPRLMG